MEASEEFRECIEVGRPVTGGNGRGRSRVHSRRPVFVAELKIDVGRFRKLLTVLKGDILSVVSNRLTLGGVMSKLSCVFEFLTCFKMPGSLRRD